MAQATIYGRRKAPALQLSRLYICPGGHKEVKFPTERTSYTNLAARVCSRVLGSNEIL